jgi:hypothetical protein
VNPSAQKKLKRRIQMRHCAVPAVLLEPVVGLSVLCVAGTALDASSTFEDGKQMRSPPLRTVISLYFRLMVIASAACLFEYLTMRKGQHVRWYIGLNDFDLHTPLWHGNTVLINNARADVTSISTMEGCGLYGFGRCGGVVV